MPQRTILAANGMPYRWERSSAPTPEDHAALARFREWTQKGGPVPAGVDPTVWVRRRRDYLVDRQRTKGENPALGQELALQNQRLNRMAELGADGFLNAPNPMPKPSGKARAAVPHGPASHDPATTQAAIQEPRRRAAILEEKRLLHDQLDAVRQSVPVYDSPQTDFIRLLKGRLGDVDRALAPGATGNLPPLSPALAQRLKSQINFSTRGIARVDDAARNAIPGGSVGVEYALEKRLKANSVGLLGWTKDVPQATPTARAKPTAPAPNATPNPRATTRDVTAGTAAKSKLPRGAETAAPLPSVRPMPNRQTLAQPAPGPLRDVPPNARKAAPVFAPPIPLEPKGGGSVPDGRGQVAPFVPLWLRSERIAPNDAPPLVLAPDHPLIAAKNLKGLDFDPVVFRQAILQKRDEIPTHLVDADSVATANGSLGMFATDEERTAQRNARENPYRTLNLGAASVAVSRALGLSRQDGSLLDPKSRAFAKLTDAVRAGGALSTRRDDLRAQVAESGGADWLYPILRRDPDIGHATTAGLVGRAVSGALSPVSTARVLLGDSRRDDELSTVEGYGYGFADLIAGGFGSAAEKGALGLGKLGTVALRRAAATGFLEGAARQAVERGFARAMAAQASRSLGRKVLSRAWGMALENGVLQSAPVVGQAADRTRANGRPFLENLRESAGEAGRGLVRLFDPRTPFDRDASAHERAMAALNLGLLLFGAGAKGYGSYRERARRAGVDPRYADLVVRAGRADGERAAGGRVGSGEIPEGGGAKGGPPVRKPRTTKLDRLADELYATPPILQKVPEPKELAEMTQHLFGRSMTAEEVADLVGAPGGSKVTIVAKLAGLEVDVVHDDLKLRMIRAFWKEPEGKTFVDGKILELRNALPGTGLIVFDRQVARYVKLGLDRIEIDAEGNRSDPNWNGYYTWARYGYNMEFSSSTKSFLRYMKFDVNDLHELFALKGGPQLWKRYGEKGVMVFDLREGSRCLEDLAAYKQTRGLNR